MNANKKLTFLTIGIILVLPIVFNTGCFKVGDDDPFLSFRTRKARVEGKWKIAEYYEYIRHDPGKDINISLTTTKSDSKKWEQTIRFEDMPDSLEQHVGTVTYNENYYKFDKYGNYEKIYNYQYIDEKEVGEDGDLIRKRHICREKIRGTWNFLADVEDDYGNKERMILNIEGREFRERIDTMFLKADDDSEKVAVWKMKSETLETQSYKNGESSEVWQIGMLKNKEMRIKQDVRNNRVVVVDGQAPDLNVSEFGDRKYTLKQD